MSKHRIMIVDDHPVLRDGVAMMLQIEPDLELAHQAESSRQALAILETETPNLLLVDISLKDGNGLDLIRRIGESKPGIPILVLSAHDEERYAERALKAGAHGYIMKSASRDDLLAAIRNVLRGEYHLSPAVSPKLLRKMLGGESDGEPEIDRVLSDRELEIFGLIGEGLDTQQIAKRLFVSPKTIRAHRNNIMRKLSLRGSIQLYQLSFQWRQEKGNDPPLHEKRSYQND
jgi:DNA-binding NarL/FixJ family response regulator